MSDASPRPTYRLRRLREGKGTVAELHDDLVGGVAATARFEGKAVFADVAIACQADGSTWRCTPNRRVMPTSWRLADGGGAVTVFAQPAGRQLLNPLGRTLLTLRRERVGETLAVVDARPAGVGRLLNLAPSDWALVRGDEALAGIGFARGPDPRGGGEETGTGVLGRLRRLAGALAGHDRCLASRASGHALTAPEAMVLLLLFEVLTETG